MSSLTCPATISAAATTAGAGEPGACAMRPISTTLSNNPLV
jgi:hypothetical protein